MVLPRNLKPPQEQLLTTLARMPRGESPVSALDGRVLRALVRRKFVSLMSDGERAVVTGAGRVYYEAHLQSLPTSKSADGNGGRRDGDGQPSTRDHLLSALDQLQRHLPRDLELKLSKPGDGLDLRAYADDVLDVLRRHVRSAT